MSSLRFCRDCANLLYPRADKVHKILTYACRNCVYFEEASPNEEERGEKWSVYRNDLMADSKESAGVTQDLNTDPTLPRATITCPYCEHREAVFFQDQSKRNLSRPDAQIERKVAPFLNGFFITGEGSNLYNTVTSTCLVILPVMVFLVSLTYQQSVKIAREPWYELSQEQQKQSMILSRCLIL